VARLRYYPTPADFGLGFGEEVPLLDEAGAPIGELVGRTAVVPSASISFQVCTSDDFGDLTTDLLDGEGAAITVWSTSEDFVTLGRGPILQGPDDHVGPLYLTPDAGTTFYRIEPDSTEVYARLAAAEAALADLTTADLTDFDLDDRADGKFVAFDNASGKNVYVDAAGTGTVTSVAGVDPDDGDIPAADLKASLGAADATTMANFMTLVQGRLYILCAPLTGGGYASKPAGWTNGIRPGAEQPAAQLAQWDIWLRPKTT
jgi:hypothetical protein